MLKHLTIALLGLGLGLGFSPVEVESQTPERQPLSLLDLLPEGQLNRRSLGINAFANERQFGTVANQLRETRRSLSISRLRVLFAWNDQVQSSANAPVFWGFYDEIARSIPRRSRAIVVVTGLPQWVRNQGGQNAEAMFLNDWFAKVSARYGTSRRIEGFQLWNEPNDSNNPDNVVLDFAGNPQNFVDFTAQGNSIIDRTAPNQKLVSAAPTSLMQNFPETAHYMQKMLDAGLEQHVDIVAAHMYGESLETILFSDDITKPLRSLTRPLWITESGAKGNQNQEEYARRLWPYLFEQFPALRRIYIYQFTDGTAPQDSFGLKSGSDGRTVSDLYRYLTALKR